VVEGWLINFEKFSMLDSVIRRIREYQSVPFQFKQVFSLAQFLSDAPVTEEAELYRMSLNVEPRPATSTPLSLPNLMKPEQMFVCCSLCCGRVCGCVCVCVCALELELAFINLSHLVFSFRLPPCCLLYMRTFSSPVLNRVCL
jgi:hypothetical protein